MCIRLSPYLAIMAARSVVPRIAKQAPSVSNITRHAAPSIASHAQRSMATVVPPVTQDATSSQGPTAMVFMNMGGPQTTAKVGDFLSRLFVCPVRRPAVSLRLTLL